MRPRIIFVSLTFSLFFVGLLAWFSIREELWMPLNAGAYQIGLMDEPIISGKRITLKGHGWYPILADNQNLASPTEVIFAKFDRWGNSPSRDVLVREHTAVLPETFIEAERKFVWGNAKLVKPRTPPIVDSRFAWLPDHNLYVIGSDADGLDEALQSLRITVQNR